MSFNASKSRKKILPLLKNCFVNDSNTLLSAWRSIQIMASLKALYQLCFLFQNFDNIDPGPNTITTVEVLLAMCMFQNNWNNLKVKKVVTGWQFMFLKLLTRRLQNHLMMRKKLEATKAAFKGHEVSYSSVGIKNFVNPIDKYNALANKNLQS